MFELEPAHPGRIQTANAADKGKIMRLFCFENTSTPIPPQFEEQGTVEYTPNPPPSPPGELSFPHAPTALRSLHGDVSTGRRFARYPTRVSRRLGGNRRQYRLAQQPYTDN